MKQMICQSCQKLQATLHQLDVVYDDAGHAQVKATDFCHICAKKAGLPVPKAASFPKIISMLSKAFLPQTGAGPATPIASESQEDLSCPDCGWTLRDLRQTSRLGCPNDYEVFADYVGEMLERLHGHEQHVDWREDNLLDQLNAELDTAVNQEDYESAARIRDRIQELESGPELGA
ncbi:MAG: UvrB/UvrC motif-containing protein [Planctomycetota bacterium]|jgi:protein arginine kinase activator|nr:UvrB/UvrC motif-containing protein [Planctomycetota bacterium]